MSFIQIFVKLQNLHILAKSSNYIVTINGLVHDCSISSVLAMEILQSYTKPSIYDFMFPDINWMWQG